MSRDNMLPEDVRGFDSRRADWEQNQADIANEAEKADAVPPVKAYTVPELLRLLRDQDDGNVRLKAGRLLYAMGMTDGGASRPSQLPPMGGV